MCCNIFLFLMNLLQNISFLFVSISKQFSSNKNLLLYICCDWYWLQVYNLNNNTVSWLRESDRHILTVGRETFISDRRFVALHTRIVEMDIIY